MMYKYYYLYVLCFVTILLNSCSSRRVEVKLPNLEGISWGVTFSAPHTRWLFENERSPESVLEAITSELGIKNYRLEAYWNWVQDSGPEVLNTDDLERQLDIVTKYGAKVVVLCLGRKVPHSPEYHVPEWAQKLSEEDLKKALLDYIKRLVSFYADDPRITAWQVENEPFFRFGEEKKILYSRRFKDQEAFLKAEIDAVREYDKLNRPIVVTAPGDWGKYKKAAKNADILGLSYYGIVYFKEIGTYFPNRWLYRDLLNLLLFPGRAKFQAEKISKSIGGKPVWLIELQAEPWGPTHNKALSLEEAAKSMDISKLRKNVKFVAEAGFDSIFFWGAEWWLWMADKGHPEMWDEIKNITNKSK